MRAQNVAGTRFDLYVKQVYLVVMISISESGIGLFVEHVNNGGKCRRKTILTTPYGFPMFCKKVVIQGDTGPASWISLKVF